MAQMVASRAWGLEVAAPKSGILSRDGFRF